MADAASPASDRAAGEERRGLNPSLPLLREVDRALLRETKGALDARSSVQWRPLPLG